MIGNPKYKVQSLDQINKPNLNDGYEELRKCLETDSMWSSPQSDFELPSDSKKTHKAYYHAVRAITQICNDVLNVSKAVQDGLLPFDDVWDGNGGVNVTFEVEIDGRAVKWAGDQTIYASITRADETHGKVLTMIEEILSDENRTKKYRLDVLKGKIAASISEIEFREDFKEQYGKDIVNLLSEDNVDLKTNKGNLGWLKDSFERVRTGCRPLIIKTIDAALNLATAHGRDDVKTSQLKKLSARLMLDHLKNEAGSKVDKYHRQLLENAATLDSYKFELDDGGSNRTSRTEKTEDRMKDIISLDTVSKSLFENYFFSNKRLSSKLPMAT